MIHLVPCKKQTLIINSGSKSETMWHQNLLYYS